MLQFMGLQRVGHDWVSKLNYNQNNCGSILNNDQLFIGNYPLHINKGKDSPLKYVLFFHPSTYTVS